MPNEQPASVSTTPVGPDAMEITPLIRAAMARQGGWLPFDRFMALALYAPGLGYYARSDRQFGLLPCSGSDFVTAPELSPLFGRALARQLLQALDGTDTDEIWEFGAGSGVLAAELLDTLGPRVRRYTIIDLSGSLRERQRAVLARHLDRVRWVDELPEVLRGVVVGNEVLDAMPVQLLHFDGERWFERGVEALPGNAREIGGPVTGSPWRWADRETALRPPVEPDVAFAPGTVTEIHPQAEAFVATIADRLQRGAAFFIDYGFPASEYYHPQRTGGTLVCHRAHRVDPDPLDQVGAKDITAHVDFTGIALAGQDGRPAGAGLHQPGALPFQPVDWLDVAGQGAEPCGTSRWRPEVWCTEHEMGELFKVIGFAANASDDLLTAPIGFAHSDRTHTL